VVNELQARLRGRSSIACRTDQGFRTVITAVPLADGRGVRLETGLGALVLTPLEIGRLRERLRVAIIESGGLPDEDAQ
jgi:hypothetical protein